MWIKRSEWEALVKRVDELERKEPRMLTDFGNRWTAGAWSFSNETFDRLSVSHADAIRAILDHLELTLEKTPETPPAVKVAKKNPYHADLFHFFAPPAAKKPSPKKKK